MGWGAWGDDVTVWGTRCKVGAVARVVAACWLLGGAQAAVGQGHSTPGGTQSGWDASTEAPLPLAGTEASTPGKRRPVGQLGTGKASTGKKAAGATERQLNAVLGFALGGDEARTTFKVALGGPIDVAARSLAEPPRVIIDMAETEFRVPGGTGRQGHGLVKAFRYGLIEGGKSRIVIDTTLPVRVERTELMLMEAGEAFQLEVEIAPTTARELAAMELAEAALNLKPTYPEAEPPTRRGPAARPVIVVDAGHGGIDPGAPGTQVAEKDLVLSVAYHVERALAATRQYEVVMTRTRDVFVALDERVAIARRHAADLFVSLHADSLNSRDVARTVRGATIYTLADHASDERTRQVADKENSADLLAGLPVSTTTDDGVRDILLDLMRRETTTFASEFRETLIGELRSGVLLSRDPRRSGPFKVLRQPGSPSVLVELGYISNIEDERIMMKPQWQAKVAAAIVRAIDEHFRRRMASRR